MIFEENLTKTQRKLKNKIYRVTFQKENVKKIKNKKIRQENRIKSHQKEMVLKFT
jgi:hypothetical protein